MRGLSGVLLCGLTPFLVLAATPAGDAYVTITAPADGASLEQKKPALLVYDVKPGPRGEHVHVYIDGREVGILRQLKGSYALRALAPGQRTVCIKVVNRAHVPIGVEQCIRVTVE
jgi:hypothetical protein